MGRKGIETGSWIPCEKCGKGLIRRKPNGLLHFVFGKMRNEDGGLMGKSPVDMLIHGSVRMPCFRKGCGHINTIDYLPPFPVIEKKLDKGIKK